MYGCEKKIYAEAHYILEHKATVRETAQAMGIGKSTVHKDVTTRLQIECPTLAKQVRMILDVNKAAERMLGGSLRNGREFANFLSSNDAETFQKNL